MYNGRRTILCISEIQWCKTRWGFSPLLFSFFIDNSVYYSKAVFALGLAVMFAKIMLELMVMLMILLHEKHLYIKVLKYTCTDQHCVVAFTVLALST